MDHGGHHARRRRPPLLAGHPAPRGAPRPPKELEDWLETDESKAAGDSATGESTGHRSGRRIVEIERTRVADLTDDDHAHMRKVVGYVRRHLAQHPGGDVADTTWAHSLKSWGHDPVKGS